MADSYFRCGRVAPSAQGINAALPEAARASLDESVLRVLSHAASGELSPMAALFGGLVRASPPGCV